MLSHTIALRTNRGRKREARVKLVIATAGSSGDLALVRLISAGGEVACVGSPLDRPVQDPVGVLAAALQTSFGRESVRAAIVHPDHLWLMNRLDPVEAMREFSRRGWQVITLHRRSAIDRGLSRAVCGEHLELPPDGPVVVDPADVLIHAHTGRLAASWLQTQVDAAERILFEDDLVTAGSRRSAVSRLAALWDLSPWEPPPDPDVPTASSLWQHVQDGPKVKAALERLVESVEPGA